MAGFDSLPSFFFLQTNTLIMKYRCRKNFRYGKQPYKIDDPFNAPKNELNSMLERGLLYETKEDKRSYSVNAKYHLEKDANTKTMYYVKKGNQMIDRLPKTKAEKLVEELNNGIS